MIDNPSSGTRPAHAVDPPPQPETVARPATQKRSAWFNGNVILLVVAGSFFIRLTACAHGNGPLGYDFVGFGCGIGLALALIALCAFNLLMVLGAAVRLGTLVTNRGRAIVASAGIGAKLARAPLSLERTATGG